MIRTETGGKLLPLEGLRGIAAVIVMLGHLVRGLVPPGPGRLSPLNRLHELVLNGGAAVAVFFVLSGFILSLPFARDRSLARVLTALLKRWPRLAALTTIACLFSWGAITLTQGCYEQAAAVTGNQWMASHFNSPLHGHEVSWKAALKEGIYRVFLFGEVRFDSPLWTMRIELFGSFAIFLAAPLLFGLRNWPLRLCLIGAAMLLAGIDWPVTYFTDFLVGTLLALLFAEGRMPGFRNWQAALMAGAAIYLFCFSTGAPSVLHLPLKALLPAGETAHFVWDASAALFILVLLGNPAVRALFSGNWAAWLGKLSFPVYLLHVPIMLSAGAASFLGSVDALGVSGAVLVAALVTILLTLAFALPLVWVDKSWTGLLGRAVRVFARPKPAVLLPDRL